ncbi:T9SS type A sorting domain-containing protein, partial [Chryseobacterium sp.]|uniref:T9SS type A sorting domain-containing protein n=1 Tax=Chryseobacterium sp. TaxID=1871047 RepID=UPI0032196EBF
VTDAIGYKISVGTTTGGTDILNNADAGSGTSYTLTNALNYSTKYYYTVNAYTATSTSASCTERSFTTSTLCPSVTAPSSSATKVSILPTITWSAITGVTGYRITMGTTAGGNDIMDNVDVGNITSYTLTTPLSYGTKYYYKVIAYAGSQVGTACTERNFTTTTLCPTVSSPSAAATGVPLQPTITWGGITGATGYRITMGTTSGGSDILNNVDLGNVTSYTHPTTLAFSTKYYYTIIAYTATLTGTACTVNSFTTQGTCPIVTYPAASATLQSITPLIKWNAMPTAAYYTLTIGTTAGGSDIMNNVNIGNVTSYTVTAPLTLGTKYYYKVNTDTSTGCTERNFTVNANPAPANDNCSGALQVASFPYAYSQTDGAGATNGTGFITTCTTTNDGMWFKFTGNGGEITVSAKSTTAWDHRVSVYSGSCGAFTCVGTTDEKASTLGNIETLTFNSVAGTVYYVNVGQFSTTDDNQEGNFDINITSSVLATAEVVKEKIKEIKVYPNPFMDILNISEISKVQSVSVIDLAGRVVKTIEKPSSQLYLADLKQGMYLVVLHMKDGTKQVVKSIKR